MDFCEKCGRYVDDDETYCPECGNMVHQPKIDPTYQQYNVDPFEMRQAAKRNLKEMIFTKRFFLIFAISFVAMFLVMVFVGFSIIFLLIPLFVPSLKPDISFGISFGFFAGLLSGWLYTYFFHVAPMLGM